MSVAWSAYRIAAPAVGMLALTPDGPRGPAERVKPGLAWLASRSGWAVVPVAAAAKRAWVLGSWDRFRIPWPFARVCLAFGEPLRVPPELDEGSGEAWRARWSHLRCPTFHR